MRRTKIVATVGPATDGAPAMAALVEAGADVVRLNAAHGGPEVHAQRAEAARHAAAERGRSIGVLVDLPGPKMRSGPIRGEVAELPTGGAFTLVADEIDGDAHQASTTMPELARWVRAGDEIFLADGAIVLRVVGTDDTAVHTDIVRGGTLRSRKGMHVPRAEAHVESFTERDRDALTMALDLRADFIGLSFVRSPDDVEHVRSLLPRRGARPALVAKIETAGALDHLAGIVHAADAVMVARGDLGIQVPARRVPLIQKEIIGFCNLAGRPVITATQMLESMTRSPLPTRAEVNDVANAVLDGTDALMLSEETAVGAHPADTVRTMAEVAAAAETWPRRGEQRALPSGTVDTDRVAWAVAHAAVQAAEDLGVAAVLCPTRSGQTARRVAAFRPSMPIAGISPSSEVLGGLSLVWGVTPLPTPDGPLPTPDGSHLDGAIDAARRADLVRDGDLVVVVFGASGPRAGSTDSVRVVRV